MSESKPKPQTWSDLSGTERDALLATFELVQQQNDSPVTGARVVSSVLEGFTGDGERSVYRSLTRLNEAGFIEIRDGPSTTKRYGVTDSGLEAMCERASRMSTALDTFTVAEIPDGANASPSERGERL